MLRSELKRLTTCPMGVFSKNDSDVLPHQLGTCIVRADAMSPSVGLIQLALEDHEERR